MIARAGSFFKEELRWGATKEETDVKWEIVRYIVINSFITSVWKGICLLENEWVMGSEVGKSM